MQRKIPPSQEFEKEFFQRGAKGQAKGGGLEPLTHGLPAFVGNRARIGATDAHCETNREKIGRAQAERRQRAPGIPLGA